jgi:hypothetical protein
MLTRRALVVGSGVAGLATAFRLRRSDWEVVLLSHDTPSPSILIPLQGQDLDAARRLGLEPALRQQASAAHLCLQDLAAVLHGVAVEHGVQVHGLAADDCGVTVALSAGPDEWFDLVVVDSPQSDVDRVPGRIVLIAENIPFPLYCTELLGDAFDIFPDSVAAVRWWEDHLRGMSGATGAVRQRARFGVAASGWRGRGGRARVRATAPQRRAEWT